jgi:hypothetical protein
MLPFRLRRLLILITIAVIQRDTHKAMKRPKKKSIDYSTWRKHRVRSMREAVMKESSSFAARDGVATSSDVSSRRCISFSAMPMKHSASEIGHARVAPAALRI